MANVLSDEKKQQVLALGRLGWSLRRIQRATGVRRETASIYLKTAGIAVRPAGAWGRRSTLPGPPETGANPTVTGQTPPETGSSNPAPEGVTDPTAANRPTRRGQPDFSLRTSPPPVLPAAPPPVPVDPIAS